LALLFYPSTKTTVHHAHAIPIPGCQKRKPNTVHFVVSARSSPQHFLLTISVCTPHPSTTGRKRLLKVF
jgi:hypothetical protein